MKCRAGYTGTHGSCIVSSTRSWLRTSDHSDQCDQLTPASVTSDHLYTQEFCPRQTQSGNTWHILYTTCDTPNPTRTQLLHQWLAAVAHTTLYQATNTELKVNLLWKTECHDWRLSFMWNSSAFKNLGWKFPFPIPPLSKHHAKPCIL